MLQANGAASVPTRMTSRPAVASGTTQSGRAVRQTRQTFAHRGVVARSGSDSLSRIGLVTTGGNRWSRPGEPTIYLGSDTSVALAEFARHLEPDSPVVGGLWTVDVLLDRIVDLRNVDVRADAALPEDPRWLLDRERCRSLAAAFRVRGAQGLIVPSVAFLDQRERWNLVVFADRLENLERLIAQPRRLASLRSTDLSRL
jgi:RES domain-containing protein